MRRCTGLRSRLSYFSGTLLVAVKKRPTCRSNARAIESPCPPAAGITRRGLTFLNHPAVKFIQDWLPVPHSFRSADASNAASPNANVADASITGSQGLTLNNCCVISLPAPIAAGMPIANPMATCEKAPLSTMRNTLPRSAPSARAYLSIRQELSLDTHLRSTQNCLASCLDYTVVSKSTMSYTDPW